jgi:hypothetical protein
MQSARPAASRSFAVNNDGARRECLVALAARIVAAGINPTPL